MLSEDAIPTEVGRLTLPEKCKRGVHVPMLRLLTET